ncbi:MAG: DUF4381 domain-containing protein [Gemmataceae bacterium]|nr:DUF4381 domain-containing protein [Gemmataceae bacterium]
MNPIWVRYELATLETAAWQRVFHEKEAGEVRIAVEGEFARKGTKRRSWGRRADPRLPAAFQEYFVLYNGEIQIRPSGKEREYIISKQSPADYAAETPLYVAGEEDFHDNLRGWVNGKYKAPKVSLSETVDSAGEKVVAVQITAATGEKYKAWLLPEQGHVLQRYERYNQGGGLAGRSEVQEFMTVNGFVYPKRGRWEHFTRDHGLGFMTTFVVKSLETEPRKVPDSLFQFELPKDASVWDDDLKVLVRNTELAQSHLEEVIRRAGPPRRWWQPWWGWAGLAGVVLLLVFAFRWYRRRTGVRPVGGRG